MEPLSQSARTWFDRLAYLQFGKPSLVLAVVGFITAVALGLATRLQVLAGFENLLPESRPSVQELHRVVARAGGVSTLFVVLEGENPAGLRRAADAIVPALVNLGPQWVSRVEDGVQDVVKFAEPRAGLFADLHRLEQVRDDVEARFAYEVGKETGTNLELSPADVPPPIDATLIRKRLGLDDVATKRFPDGYYQSEDGKQVVVAMRCTVLGTDFAKGQEVIAKVRETVAQVNPAAFDPSVKWGITGDLAIGTSEYKAIIRDLTQVGVLGAVLILGVVLLYYLRIRTVIAMTLTISVGLCWTFGLTELVLGHLNLATSFLFTIVGGNGINVGIIFMARYLEERRRGRSLKQAIVMAQRETWLPTLAGAGAAAGSYGALLITAFKGFREFGVIGGAGMLICWVATYLTLPPILVLMERVAPLDREPPGFLGAIRRMTREGVPFGRPFAYIVARVPRAITIAGALLAVAGVVTVVRYVRTDPMEYDLNQIQSAHPQLSEEDRLIRIAKDITQYIGLDGMAVVTDRVEQVAPLKAALEARRNAAPADAKPFEAVHILQDFVPPDQSAKIAILQQLKDRILRARRRHLISDEDWAKIGKYLPADDLKPFGIDDLPDGVARAFTERDGTRGRILYITPVSTQLTNDAHYLFRWADSFRRTELPDGSVVFGSGRAVIYADMWSAILEDVPPAVCASFLATLAIIALAFRGRRAAVSVVLALLVGVSWMVGTLSVFHAKLNFLNFIALPITFGIGVDYAVNVVQRDLGIRDPVEVLRRTGGAVVLCSMTTLLGYLALVRSTNFGVRSLGIAAVTGEVTCLLAAVLVLPAATVWWRRDRRAPEAPLTTTPSVGR